MPYAAAAWFLTLCLCFLPVTTARANAPLPKPPAAFHGLVKDRALARVLGQMLFQDTVAVMSDGVAAAESATSSDKSAVGQVARTVLAHQTLDKYLWLIRQAYDDTLWRGGDRARIEQHFPLIWRTSILLYESTLDATPHRVRVCTPTDTQDEFECRDQIEHARMVPIPSRVPFIVAPHAAVIG